MIGTPVWWYRPVPAIRTFLTKNDLSGKVIKLQMQVGWEELLKKLRHYVQIQKFLKE